MEFEYQIIPVDPFTAAKDVVKKLDSYGRWGYKVVGVYPSRDEHGLEDWSIILMRVVE